MLSLATLEIPCAMTNDATRRWSLLLYRLHHWRPSMTCSLPWHSRFRCWSWWYRSCNSCNGWWPHSSSQRFQPFPLQPLIPAIDFPGKDLLIDRVLIDYDILHLAERVVRPLGKILLPSDHLSVAVFNTIPSRSLAWGAMTRKRVKVGKVSSIIIWVVARVL